MRASAAPRREWRPRPKATWRSTADHHGPVYGPRLVREISKTGKTSHLRPDGRRSGAQPAGPRSPDGHRDTYRSGLALEHLVHGFDQASRVVVAAAVIMVSVFAGFIFTHDVMIKQMGFALAIGILIDAFLVRITLTPALMALFGDKAWWLPRWLDRILPDLDVEGDRLLQMLTRREDGEQSPRPDAVGPK